jgi:hypothetical protein
MTRDGRNAGRAVGCALPALLGLLALGACTPLDREAPRPARSSLACMRAVVHEQVPADANDKLKHCLATGLIARHCSVAEAHIAEWGKEFTDVFDGGDPSADDIRADRVGLRCAEQNSADTGVRACCEAAY